MPLEAKSRKRSGWKNKRGKKVEGSEKFRLETCTSHCERVSGTNQTFPLRVTRKSD